jgi:hypothetical protein
MYRGDFIDVSALAGVVGPDIRKKARRFFA